MITVLILDINTCEFMYFFFLILKRVNINFSIKKGRVENIKQHIKLFHCIFYQFILLQ